MSDQEKHIPTYSSSDIEKYLSGELSAPEMHALERAALDDPFLADALEGMAAHRQLPEQPSFSNDMTELQKRLADRVAVKKKSRVLPLFMRYAAVVILLAGIGLTIFYLNTRQKNDTVATMQTHRPPAQADSATPGAAEPGLVSPPSDALSSSSAKADRAVANVPDTEKKNEASTPEKDSQKEEEQYKTKRALENALAAKQANNNVETVKTVPVANQVARKNAPPEILKLSDGSAVQLERDDRRMAFKDKTDTMQFHFDTTALKATTRDYYNNATGPLVFSGKVTDLNNHPLSGAYLTLQNNQLVNTRTDIDGNFSLHLQSPRDTTSSVAVNYVGYQQGILSFNSDNRVGNIIQLKPQTASLNEVVVSGYGAKRREYLRKDIDAPQKALSLVAVPANGWPAYNEYLEANKRSVSLDSTLRGNEIISFVVDKSGGLSGFKVEQSISPAHDALLTRLIKQGPTWRLLSGRKERARVILTY